MPNVFDQFDQQSQSQTPAQPVQGNAFDQFDPGYKQSQQAAQQQQQPAPGQSQGTFMDNIDILNKNFANLANGGLQAGAQALSAIGFDTSAFQRMIAQDQARNQALYDAAMQNSPMTGTVTDIASKIGATVAAPGAQPFLAAAPATVAGRMLATGAASAIAGGQDYVDPNEGRIDNAVKSGLIGSAAQGVFEGAGKLVQAGAKKLFTTPVEEAAAAADKGLLTTMGSATGNPALQGAEEVLGRVPVVGAKGAIGRQVGALKQETMNVLDDLGIQGQSQVDLGTQLSTAIKSSYKAAKANTDEAYKAASDIATAQGINIPLTETQGIAKTALQDLADLRGAGIASADVGASKTGQLLSDLAELPEGQIPAKMYDTLRRKVNSTISSLSRGDDTEGLQSVFTQIRGALDNDLNAAGAASKEFGDALKKARDIYQTQKAPFQDTDVLKKAVQGTIDTDQLLNVIVKNDRPVLTNKIMSSLTGENKQAFTKAIINKAASDSMVADASGAVKEIDLSAFTKKLNNLGETLNSLPKNEQMKIQGLQKLLNRGDYLIKTDKASMNNLGSYTAGALGAGVGSTLGLAPLIQAAGATKVVSSLLTSPKMTKALIKLAGGKLGQRAEDSIIRGVISSFGKNASSSVSGSVPTPPPGSYLGGVRGAIKQSVIPTIATELGTGEE